MERDQSKSSSDRSYSGLPRAHILRGRTNFERLFNDPAAQTFFCTHFKLRFLLFTEEESKGCLMGFVTPKHTGNAVKRNRTRRRAREAYRLHQALLRDAVTAKRIGFHGVIIARTAAVDFHSAEHDMTVLLSKAAHHINAAVSA